jgi:hypothetical protein
LVTVYGEWLRLRAAGVQKVVPAQAVLETAYRRAVQQAAVQEAIAHALRAFTDAVIPVPADLEAQIHQVIMGTVLSWDMAIRDLATDARS